MRVAQETTKKYMFKDSPSLYMELECDKSGAARDRTLEKLESTLEPAELDVVVGKKKRTSYPKTFYRRFEDTSGTEFYKVMLGDKKYFVLKDDVEFEMESVEGSCRRRRRLKEFRPIHRLYNEILDANDL